ncbi:DUF488 domain-containing protein [uncultured Abiotrophia sp.]|uniref:DUF488 domain-containing protein n=1 Tax=uncultured Abiotrophia sp. TaxID=316094 RepID=UPI0026029B0D|nr:DUF488 domain-containing protein [uncultured Abiotrophia sp.]
MGILYTIGHSTFEISNLVNNLKKYNINYLLDVRSMPYSRFAPQYNKSELERELKKHNIKYFYMGKFFGARQLDRTFYPNGYIDFSVYRKSDLFLKGKTSVLRGLKEYNIALMCTEKNPIECHRTIMIARDFEVSDVKVMHILHDGKLKSQEEISNELLERFFPDRHQVSLFNEENKDINWYLDEAYKKQNELIGYRIGEEE